MAVTKLSTNKRHLSLRGGGGLRGGGEGAGGVGYTEYQRLTSLSQLTVSECISMYIDFENVA
jgi:hypothetical protein